MLPDFFVFLKKQIEVFSFLLLKKQLKKTFEVFTIIGKNPFYFISFSLLTFLSSLLSFTIILRFIFFTFSKLLYTFSLSFLGFVFKRTVGIFCNTYVLLTAFRLKLFQVPQLWQSQDFIQFLVSLFWITRLTFVQTKLSNCEEDVYHLFM